MAMPLSSEPALDAPPASPAPQARPKPRRLETSFYMLIWCITSNATIVFNKWLIDDAKFTIILTAWHLVFATVVTQILARTTTLLDDRHQFPVNGRYYLRTLLPIGLAVTGSLVCSNLVYLYLSLPFIQMLKAGGPVATLVMSWAFRVADPSAMSFFVILVIVSGVVIASAGEGSLSWIGVVLQLGGTVSEALRLVLTQVMLAGDGLKMNPLVGLYFYAPVCACVLMLVAVALEGGSFQWSEVSRVGYLTLLSNAAVSFSLNMCSLLLIGKTSGLVVTLTSIFKNIALIIFAVLFWQTRVSGLQALGYSIALCGLVAYSLGYDGLVAVWNGCVSRTSHLNKANIGPRKYMIYIGAALISMIITATLLVGGSAAYTRVPIKAHGEPELGNIELGERMATCGSEKFMPSREQWKIAVDKYSGLLENKFTIAMQTYQRPESLDKTLQALTETEIPSLHEIVVVWNEIDKTPPSDYVSKHGVAVRYRLSERNSLNMKLIPDPQYETQAIMLHDDDVYYHPDDLDFVFQTWRQFGKHKLVGGLPRCAELDKGKLKYDFCPEHSDTYDMVLSNLAFLHISFLDFYSSDNEYATAIREHVDEFFNCEDIGMNYIASMLTCTGPLQVVGKEDYVSLHPDKGISSGKDHVQLRNDCLNNFKKLFGYPVLVGQTARIVRGVKRLGG